MVSVEGQIQQSVPRCQHSTCYSSPDGSDWQFPKLQEACRPKDMLRCDCNIRARWSATKLEAQQAQFHISKALCDKLVCPCANLDGVRIIHSQSLGLTGPYHLTFCKLHHSCRQHMLLKGPSPRSQSQHQACRPELCTKHLLTDTVFGKP
jgi:hypothetical protein